MLKETGPPAASMPGDNPGGLAVGSAPRCHPWEAVVGSAPQLGITPLLLSPHSSVLSVFRIRPWYGCGFPRPGELLGASLWFGAIPSPGTPWKAPVWGGGRSAGGTQELPTPPRSRELRERKEKEAGRELGLSRSKTGRRTIQSGGESASNPRRAAGGEEKLRGCPAPGAIPAGFVPRIVPRARCQC